MSSAAEVASTAPFRLVQRPGVEPTIGKTVEDGVLITNDQLRQIDPDVRKARQFLRRMLLDLRTPPAPVRGPTARPKAVRLATKSDELAVYDLAVMDLTENARVAPISRDEVAKVIMRGTRQQGGIVSVIDGQDGKPVALQILIASKWWWSNQWYIQKMVDFVHPDHRGTRHAQHLVQFSKWVTDEWSREFGYQIYLLSGVLSPTHSKRKSRLYARQMTPVGETFLYPFPEMYGGG